MTVIVRTVRRSPSHPSAQSGVALLQVLLLGAIFSIMGIQFSQTARDQILIAEQYENRVLGQLAAHSAINELIFFQLSGAFFRVSADIDERGEKWASPPSVNLHGEPITWGDGVTLIVQDLNGLLPLLFPEHFLWQRVLHRLNIPPQEVKRYLGTWQDLQDKDTKSWLAGDQEPAALDSGQRYINAYAQNNKVLEWVFNDRKEIFQRLNHFSHIHADYSSNLLNAPDALLEILFEPETGAAIRDLRKKGDNSRVLLRELLPNSFDMEELNVANSSKMKVSASVQVGSSIWQEHRIIHLTPVMNNPFQILVNN